MHLSLSSLDLSPPMVMSLYAMVTGPYRFDSDKNLAHAVSDIVERPEPVFSANPSGRTTCII